MTSTNTRDHKLSFRPPSENGKASPCLFLVNAEPRLRSAIEQVLRREGFQVDVVAGGYEVLPSSPGQDVIQKGRIMLRRAEQRVLLDNKDVHGLTPKEYALLQELVIRSPRVVEKIGLVMKVWGLPLEQVGRKTLDVHIQRVRRKLGPAGSSCLKTVSLLGYQWIETPAR